MEGMVYAALAYSTIARGRIVDDRHRRGRGGAGRRPGDDASQRAAAEQAPPFMSKPKAAGPDDLPIMQDDRIHWNGQPIAVVLAETQEQADHARVADPRHLREQSPVISLRRGQGEGNASPACSWASR